MNNMCFNCEKKGTDLFGYIICESCEKNLKLFSDKTVAKHIQKFTKPIYQKEIVDRLILIEKDVIKKKIKLLDILNKIEK